MSGNQAESQVTKTHTPSLHRESTKFATMVRLPSFLGRIAGRLPMGVAML